MSGVFKSLWRISSNDRYREVVAVILSRSTGGLLRPVFLARKFLGISEKTPRKAALTCTTYWAWICLAASILSCIIFQFFSAKWVRLAWEQPVGVIGIPVSENFVEHALEISLWLAIIGFFMGVILTLLFLVSYVPRPDRKSTRLNSSH